MTLVEVRDRGRLLAFIDKETGKFTRLPVDPGTAAGPLKDLETWTDDGRYLFASGGGQKISAVAEMNSLDWYMLGMMLMLDLTESEVRAD